MSPEAIDNPVVLIETDNWAETCGALLRQKEIDKPLVVTSRGAVKRFAIDTRLRSETIYGDISGLTDKRALQKLLDTCSQKSFDGVFGVGGGSALDSARIAKAALENNCYDINLLLSRSYQCNAEIPLILIPTTHGSGSEMTPWATVWDRENQTKQSLSARELYADVAILDPQLTLSLPREMTLSSSLDALSHGFEVLWNKNRTDVLEEMAIESIGEIIRTLGVAINDPQNIAARRILLQAANRAGRAFSQTKTAAAHAISYPLTMHYGVSHGMAAAMPLVPLLRRYSHAIEKSVNALVTGLGLTGVDALIEKIESLIQCSSRSRLRAYGMQKKDIPALAVQAYTKERMENFITRITEADMVMIIAEIY